MRVSVSCAFWWTLPLGGRVAVRVVGLWLFSRVPATFSRCVASSAPARGEAASVRGRPRAGSSSEKESLHCAVWAPSRPWKVPSDSSPGFCFGLV